MAVNRFVLNGISYHGHGAIQEIPGLIKERGYKKAFVASDPDLVKFGVTAKVTDLLAENGIDFEAGLQAVHELATSLNNEEPGLATLGRLLLELQQELNLRVLCAGNRLYHGCKITKKLWIVHHIPKDFILLQQNN